MCVCACVCVCMYVGMYVYMNVCMCVCMRTYVYQALSIFVGSCRFCLHNGKTWGNKTNSQGPKVSKWNCYSTYARWKT